MILAVKGHKTACPADTTETMDPSLNTTQSVEAQKLADFGARLTALEQRQSALEVRVQHSATEVSNKMSGVATLVLPWLRKKLLFPAGRSKAIVRGVPASAGSGPRAAVQASVIAKVARTTWTTHCCGRYSCKGWGLHLLQAACAAIDVGVLCSFWPFNSPTRMVPRCRGHHNNGGIQHVGRFKITRALARQPLCC